MMLYQTPLAHRRVLEITGADRAVFLQGLITNDIQTLTPEHSIYATLLTAKGRFLYDFFIMEKEGAYLIDAEAARFEDLVKKLSLYKLRSDVALTPRPDLTISALWGEGIAAHLGLPEKRGVTHNGLCVDPRLVELGVRAIGAQEIGDIQTMPIDAYHQHRLTLGVPEGGLDLVPEKTIPLEAGLDELGAISWTKGCYLGQELTARTKHSGIVRKRIFPVTLEGPPPLQGSSVLQNGEAVGEMLTHSGTYGLALLRLEAFEKNIPFLCEEARLTPHQPSWMVIPEIQA